MTPKLESSRHRKGRYILSGNGGKNPSMINQVEAKIKPKELNSNVVSKLKGLNLLDNGTLIVGSDVISINEESFVNENKGEKITEKELIKLTKNIKNIDFSNANNLTKIDDDAFFGCTGITKLELPNSLTEIGDGAFSGCTGITELKLPDSLTEIGEGVFKRCTGITKLELPNSLTEISHNTFSECTGIKELKLPNRLTEIGVHAFSGCTGIKELKLPNRLTEIGGNTFYGCTGITGELKLPESLTEIGEYAFKSCTGIEKINLSNNVIKKIEDGAFYGCINIKIVSMSDDTINIETELESIKQKLVKITANNSWNKLGEIKDTKPDNDNCLIIKFKSDSDIKYYVIDLSKNSGNTNSTQKGGRKYKTKRLATRKRYNRNSKKH